MSPRLGSFLLASFDLEVLDLLTREGMSIKIKVLVIITGFAQIQIERWF